MCGIAGIINFDKSNVDSKILRSFSDTLFNRGPDDYGFLGWGGQESSIHVTREAEKLSNCWLGLVHRRLAILDLSEAGWQPMVSNDGRYSIVFNGEIYNYLELQSELSSLGYIFHSHSDTEVLLAAYIHWGKKALNRLVGMFAFAILDTLNNKLFLARDFFGIKPLYFCAWNTGFAFASEIKALLNLPNVSRKVNPQKLYDYLCFGITEHGGETLLNDIQRLPPAHFLEIKITSPVISEPQRYWRIKSDEIIDISFLEASRKLQELFLNSINLHLRSDVQIGSALSGGIDSSSIVMAIRYLYPDLQLHTFSYIASEPKLNEEKWIDIIVKESNSYSHKIHLSSEELVYDLEKLISCQDQPFMSTSIYAQHRVFRSAHEFGIKVMLDGQGADEMLGGYPPFIGAKFSSLIKKGKFRQAGSFLKNIYSSQDVDTLMFLIWGGSFLLPDSLKRYARGIVGKSLNPAWLNSDWFRKKDVKFQPFFSGSNRTDILKEQLQNSLENRLLSLLAYEDRNSMEYSIESRVPFLNPNLANFIFSLPEDYIISEDGNTKSVFREAMRGIVPDAILNRRDKIGFTTPEANWLSSLSPWVEEIFDSQEAHCIPALNMDIIKKEWAMRKSTKHSFDGSVWRWINLIRWSAYVGLEF